MSSRVESELRGSNLVNLLEPTLDKSVTYFRTCGCNLNTTQSLLLARHINILNLHSPSFRSTIRSQIVHGSVFWGRRFLGEISFAVVCTPPFMVMDLALLGSVSSPPSIFLSQWRRSSTLNLFAHLSIQRLVF
jgi:hypothetical protein